MARYLISRLFLCLMVILAGLTITFIIPRIGPADPVTAALSRVFIMDDYTDPEIVESMLAALKVSYGLEGSLWEQYAAFLRRAIVGDFGHSIFSPTITVSTIIAVSLPWTVGLLLTTTLLSWLLGNLIGLVAGYHKRKSTQLLEYIALVVQPIPYYVLALISVFLFAYLVRIFPSSGAYTPGRIPKLDIASMLDVLNHAFLPGLSLVLSEYGWTFLSMEALTLTVKKDDYVLFAKMKGLNQNKVMTGYVMRNAMLPQLTQLAMRLGSIFNGALIMENVFAYPGLGYKLYLAITTFDLNLMMGIVTVSIFAVATAVLVLDLAYPFIDPRIRFK